MIIILAFGSWSVKSPVYSLQLTQRVEQDDIWSEIEQLNEPYKLEILDSILADELIARYYIGCPGSRNDIITSTSVLAAAALVFLTDSLLPDLAVGLLLTFVFVRSAGKVFLQLWREMQQV